MAGLTDPRGPLPARVYWLRRAVVLGVALLVVVGLGKLLTIGSDGASEAEDKAVQAGSETSQTTETEATEATPTDATPTATAPTSADPTAGPTTTKKGKKSKQPKPAPAVPDGECLPSDVLVDAQLNRAVAGQDVVFWLHLKTTGRAACTWAMDADTLAMKITSGSDQIWQSSQCPDAVPDLDVTVRAAQERIVKFAWDARRSNTDCTRQREWVSDPGYYHLETAALGGKPSDTKFELVLPTRPTITASPSPNKSASSKPTAKTTKNR